MEFNNYIETKIHEFHFHYLCHHTIFFISFIIVHQQLTQFILSLPNNEQGKGKLLLYCCNYTIFCCLHCDMVIIHQYIWIYAYIDTI